MATNDSTTDQVLNDLSGRSVDMQILQTLNQINGNLNKVLEGFNTKSQSAARDAADSTRNYGSNSGPFGQHHANYTGRNSNSWGSSKRNTNQSFADALEKSLLDSLGASSFKKAMRGSIEKFARAMGTDVEGLKGEVNNSFSKMIANQVKNTKLGRAINQKIESATKSIFSEENTSKVSDLLKGMKDGTVDINAFKQGLQSLDFGAFNSIIHSSSLGFATATEGWMASVGSLAGGLGGIALAAYAVKNGFEGVTDILGGFGQLFDAISASANRYEETRKKNLEAANKRFRDDITTIITEPFNILKRSAEEVYSAWNANIRLIGGTQGYSKEDLQNLMSAYAKRIQQEGLSRSIAVTDVYNNLAKVIQSGLTGNAAVEFAYQATKYNAAMPNQDFFSLVDSYSSVAANAIAAGKSEAEALRIANASLEDFSNGLLYASRELVGGYSTGLKSANDIYASAVKIAQAARSENISGISNALLAIQGYVGSIAPDLANTLSDKIYQLATGGNSADIVALRSLAGINASNTEFLKALAASPQKIISNMFANLGNMFNQSPDAYMEKAEGYASLFGLTSEALQRIDFMSLSAAVANMQSNTDNLEENLKQLRDGQTTTSADQMKIAQINKYMVEEGLAYVIDNEAAQMIQQHLWDEQLARQMTEAEYGVNLKGSAAEGLQKIVSGVSKILTFLNPVALLTKIVSSVANIAQTAVESEQEQSEIKKVLEAGKVGQGNQSDLLDLIRRNRDANLTQTLVQQLGQKSAYDPNGVGKSVMKAVNALGHVADGVFDLVTGRFFNNDNRGSAGANAIRSGYVPKSSYSWGSISKISAMAASAVLQAQTSTNNLTTKSDLQTQMMQEAVSAVTGTASSSAAVLKQKIDSMLDDSYLVDKFINAGKSYEDWMKSATSLGIADMKSALDEVGYKQTDIEEYFLSKQTEAGMAKKLEEGQSLEDFHQSGINFWNNRFWSDYSSPVTSMLSSISGGLLDLVKIQSEWRDWDQTFKTAWVDQVWKSDFLGTSETSLMGLVSKATQNYVNSIYSEDIQGRISATTAVKNAEKAEQGDAAYKLADILTSNFVDLKNPTVQTNVLLAQILNVVFAIMNQNNSVAGVASLPDALTSLALGLTANTPISENNLLGFNGASDSGKF